MLASIFEDEGLFDKRPCESGCRSANAKYFAGKALIIRRLAGREASEQSIPEQGVVPWNVNRLVCPVPRVRLQLPASRTLSSIAARLTTM